MIQGAPSGGATFDDPFASSQNTQSKNIKKYVASFQFEARNPDELR